MEDLHEFAYLARFSIVNRRPFNYLKKDGFGLTRYDIECNKGPIRNSTALSRNTLTSKKDYP